MQTNYNKLIPEKVLFPLSEVQDIGILKISTAKKMIDKGLLEIVRIGNKIHISRTELIRYLEDNTTEKTA
ncbi:FAD-binding protein [Arcobacter defluvii]|nr:FAD-binding protein [Arcobacter defluvii]